MKSPLLLIALTCIAATGSACARPDAAASVPADKPAAQERGVLFIDMSDHFPKGQVSPKELIEEQVALLKQMAGATKVEIVERTDRRVVAELDYVAMGGLMARGNPSNPPCPSRWVFEVDPKGDEILMRSRFYYIGNDPEVTAKIRAVFKAEPGAQPKP